MKTTNFLRIALRIVLQALIPMLFLDLVIILFFGYISPKTTIKEYLGYAFENYNLVATCILGSSITLFGIWFHFISEHRFKNRKPKGLYKEYIAWLIHETHE